MLKRRPLLIAPLAAVLAGPLPTGPAQAQQRRSQADPLRLGVDTALADSGLAQALQQAFARDTGINVLLVRQPALAMLEALERGELDAGLCNAPEAEAKLDKQGLVHDRQPIARGEFVIVGPGGAGSSAKGGNPARIGGLHDAAQALQRLRDAALAAPGSITFLSANDGSGAHVAEQALWRAAKVAPGAPWFMAAAPGAPPGATLIAQARARSAYALVERGDWAAHGGGPLAVLVDGDPALMEAVHVMRSFRVTHPAGKLFVAWIASAKGRRVAAGVRGYRAL